MNMMLRLGRTGVMTVAWLLIVPCLFLIVSAAVPVIPWVRIYAVSVVPNRAPWLLVWSLVALAIALITHRVHETPMSRRSIAITAIGTLAAAGVVLHLLYIAYSNGARIDLAKSLSSRDFGDGAAPDESRIYSRPQGEPLWLDIYRPTIPRGTLSPVMLVVHGGGFFEGSRIFGAANLRWYADHGWTVISIDYRLARPGRPTWDLATGDVRCAMAWTAAHAASLGIDMDRLTLTGASAGGSLALAAAYTNNAAPPSADCGPRVPRAASIIVKVPLIDPLGSWQHPGELRDLQRTYLEKYIGGSPEAFPARYAAVDLRRYLAPGNPPTLILGGAADALVPPEGAKDFTRRANAIGNAVRLILFPYSGHDFNTAYESITNQALLQIIARFMADHRPQQAVSASHGATPGRSRPPSCCRSPA